MSARNDSSDLTVAAQPPTIPTESTPRSDQFERGTDPWPRASTPVCFSTFTSKVSLKPPKNMVFCKGTSKWDRRFLRTFENPHDTPARSPLLFQTQREPIILRTSLLRQRKSASAFLWRIWALQFGHLLQVCHCRVRVLNGSG